MERKKFTKTTWHPLPRSVLSSLNELLLDPKDGHGARSMRDVMILQKWKAAQEGDDDALIHLLKLIIRENHAQLKAARHTRQFVTVAGGRVQMRSLVPVMTVLRMISVENVGVPREYDGCFQVTSRRKIIFEDWLEHHAFDRNGLDPILVDKVRRWIALGAIQRPFRGEVCD